MREFEQENGKLREEREILRKAAALSSRVLSSPVDQNS
jgi:hypothetical protein